MRFMLAAVCLVACSDGVGVRTAASHIGPEVGPELAMDPPVATGLATDGARETPAGAWNGTSYLAVWYHAGTAQVQARLVGADGSLGATVDLGHGDWNAEPSVASDGTDFLVAWTDASDIVARRVAGDGTPLGAGSSTVDAPATYADDAAVAWNGAHYLVAYRRGGKAAAVRLDGAGAVVGAPFDLQATTCGYDPSVAALGSTWLVAWSCYIDFTNEDVYSATVAADGTAGTPLLLGTGTGQQYNPSVAAGTTSWLVAWQSASGYSISARRVDLGGATLDPVALDGGPYGAPTVTFDGTNWRITQLQTGGNLHGKRISTAGVAVDAAPVLIHDPVYTGGEWRSVAGAGTNALVLFRDTPTGLQWDVGGLRIDGVTEVDGIELDIAVSTYTTANPERTPAVATNGDRYLVVWADERAGSGATEIRGSFVTTDGIVLAPEGFAIATGSGVRTDPAVASDGADFMVVWEDETVLHRALVTAAGVVGPVEDLPFSFPRNETDPTVAGNGVGVWMIAWTASSGIDPTPDVGFGLIASDGTVVRDTRFIGDARDPALVFDGTDFVVAWVHSGTDGIDLYASRVDVAGEFVGTIETPLSTEAGVEQPPGIAFGDGMSLIAWRVDYEIRCARMREDGVVLDLPILVANGASGDPAVAWDGTGFLVTWAGPTAPNEVRAARVSVDGVVEDFDGFVVAGTADNERTPAIASAGGGVSLVAYTRDDRGAGFLADRTRARLVGSDGLELAADAAVGGGAADAAVGGGADAEVAGGVDAEVGAPDAAVGAPDAGGGGGDDDGWCAVGAGGRGTGGGVLILLVLVVVVGVGRWRRQVDGDR